MASIVVSGDTSGAITIAAPAVAGTNTLTLPASTGTLVVTGGAQTIEFADGSASAPSITNSGDTNTGMFFPAADTIAFTEGGVESMRIDSSGNVGIGVTNPSSFYSLADNLVLGAGTGSHGLTIYSGSDSSGYIGFNDTVSNSMQGFIQYNHSGDYMAFAPNGSEKMRITSGGVVVVGATSAFNGNVLFSVQGSGGMEAKATGGTNFSPYLAWNNATSGDNIFHIFYTETSITQRGSIDYNRGAGLVRYNTSSDATLKNIIGDSDRQKSIEILNTTRIREFAWKDDAEQKPQIGVIAQELYETYKGAVSVGGEQEDGKYRPWGVDKTAFTFHLIAGWQAHEKIIQEQQQIINDLKARIETLEGAK